MAMTLEDLAAYFKELSGEKGNEEIREAKAQEAASIFRDLVELTPKDTGRASANWRPQTTPVETSHYELYQNPNTPQSVYEYAKNIPIGTDLYIGNALKYISRLDEGYSKQRPQGFTKIALVRSKNRATSGKVKLDLKK